jgi:hypothetical protein
MSVMSIVADTVSEMTGNPKKALLILHTDTSQQVDSQSIAEKAAAALAKGSGLEGAAGVAELLGSTFHVLKVQYNPASISIRANAESVEFQYLQKNIDSSIPNQNVRPPAVVMSVDLLFDAVNVKDCFMTDQLGLTASNARATASFAASAALGKLTVQPQTNGLIGMIMRNSTRTVTFKWADMTFSGEVTEVSARYTMFSIAGAPVRSVVTLSISQNVSSKADAKYWDNAFTKCFGAMGSSASKGGKSIGETFDALKSLSF